MLLKKLKWHKQAGLAFQTPLHKQRLHLDNNIFLHVSTDQAVVGSQRRIVKTPVVQVILSGVKVPACGVSEVSDKLDISIGRKEALRCLVFLHQ